MKKVKSWENDWGEFELFCDKPLTLTNRQLDYLLDVTSKKMEFAKCVEFSIDPNIMKRPSEDASMYSNKVMVSLYKDYTLNNRCLVANIDYDDTQYKLVCHLSKQYRAMMNYYL